MATYISTIVLDIVLVIINQRIAFASCTFIGMMLKNITENNNYIFNIFMILGFGTEFHTNPWNRVIFYVAVFPNL